MEDENKDEDVVLVEFSKTFPGVIIWSQGKKCRITAVNDFQIINAAWSKNLYPPKTLDDFFALTGEDNDPRAELVAKCCNMGLFNMEDMIGQEVPQEHPFLLKSIKFLPDWYVSELEHLRWFWSDYSFEDLHKNPDIVRELMDTLL